MERLGFEHWGLNVALLDERTGEVIEGWLSGCECDLGGDDLWFDFYSRNHNRYDVEAKYHYVVERLV